MLLTTAISLQLIAYALVLGGMLALGAFTAPVLFQQFPRPEAGAAMTVIFRRYDLVLSIALVMLLIGEALRWGAIGSPVWTNGFAVARFVLVLGLAGTLVAGTQVFGPKLELLQKDPALHQDSVKMAEFQSLHKQSEGVYKVALILALLLLIGSACESAHANRNPSEPAAITDTDTPV